MSCTDQQHEEPPLVNRRPFESVFSTVLRGWTIDRRRTEGSCEPTAPGAVRLIALKHIEPGGKITDRDPEADDWRSDAPERFHLRPGDILLSSVTFDGRSKAALVQETDLPAVAVRNIIVLRPAEPLSTERSQRRSSTRTQARRRPGGT